MAIYFLYLLFSPLIFLFIHFYKFFNQKLFDHIKNEKQLFLQVLKNIDYSKKLLIFHAASAGEFEQLKPLLKKINRNKYFILQTFTSPT
ncbi:3-deoxy-D-manno-octulosonic acid transferase, partial [Candidatus Marinimicrobia bacterium]|nr:3-deoxy-D-manno-octulosonic acid transferase [Candidatus Neomarinimicrobiota bacterium]